MFTNPVQDNSTWSQSLGLSGLFGQSGSSSDSLFGLGGLGGNDTSSSGATGLDSAPFELALIQVLARLLDRLEQRSASSSTATSSSTPAVSASANSGSWYYLNGVNPTPGANAAAAQQAYGATATVTAAPAASASAEETRLLAAYPHPADDNGRGMHWIPTVSQTPEVVDRFVSAAKDMHIKWVTFLNDGTNVGANDYLVKQLTANGIEPVMRVYTSGVQPLDGDLGAMVQHYAGLGVHYFQLYNEPNVAAENAGQAPDVNRYLDAWIPAAKTVIENGGRPGFGALSPGGELKDTDFLAQALEGLHSRGELGLLDQSWLSIHNYQGDRPVDDTAGFTRFKVYADVLQQKLGRLLPMIGTEGGTFAAGPADEARRTQLVTDAYQYMNNREPYNFAYSYWVIANAAGGGHDPAWEAQALYQIDGQSPLVAALTNLS